MIIIVGNGIAAIQFADNLRKKDHDVEIVILAKEKYPSYSRIWLPHYLAGTREKESLFVREKSWYEENKITNRLGCEVTSIDRVGKTAIFNNENNEEETLEYDKLVLATGSAPRMFDYNSKGIKGMFALRSLDDAETISSYIEENKGSVAIIGGGLLGLELANALAEGGISVIVIEVFPYLLPRQIDETGGTILKNFLESKSISFVLDKKVAYIEGVDKVSSLRLESGEEIEASTILQQVGIIPNIELAKKASLKTDKGIVVDNGMVTSDENILAIGDCAEYNSRIYGIIPACLDQARAATRYILDGEKTYTGTTVKTKLKVAGLSLTSLGGFGDACGDTFCESIVHENAKKFLYRKACVCDGVLKAAVILGDENSSFFSANMNKEVDMVELQKEVGKES